MHWEADGMGAGAELEGRRRDERRESDEPKRPEKRRPSRTRREGATFSMHLRSPLGLVGLALYAAAALLLLQRGIGAPVSVLALAATWRWGFLLGATSSIHSAIVAGEPVAAGVTALGSLLAGLGTAHALRSGR